MTLRLNGSTSGYVEIDAPATAGSNTLTLPNGNGSSGQYLQTNGSGTLSWQTVAVPAATSVAVLVDEKPQATNGGTFTAGAWQTRDLNTEVSDLDGIVTLATNQFTLGAGTYLIAWEAPGYRCGLNQSRLYDVTGAAVVEPGMSGYAESGAQWLFVSTGKAVVTPTANNVYEIQHHCSVTRANDGYGVRGNAGPERYTRVTITKVA